MGELLVAPRHPELLGEVARERGDGGAVARGARVALVERPDEPAQHAPRQVRVLPRALARDDDEPQHVRERDDVEGRRRRAPPGPTPRRSPRSPRRAPQLIAIAGKKPRSGRAGSRGSSAPSRIAISGGTIAELSAIVTAVATISSATNTMPWRAGRSPRTRRRRAIAGVDGAGDVDQERPPAVALDDPHGAVRHRRDHERGRRAEEADRQHVRREGGRHGQRRRVPRGDQLGGHRARGRSSAASGVNSWPRSESASPTSPMATREAGDDRGARWAGAPRRLSMAYGKLARALPVPATTWTNVPTPRLSAALACGPDLRSEAAARRSRAATAPDLVRRPAIVARANPSVDGEGEIGPAHGVVVAHEVWISDRRRTCSTPPSLH